MVSATLIKLSSPVARSFLVAISITLLIDAILIIYSSILYPFLLDQYHDHLYILESQTIAIVYSTISIIAIVLAISTAATSYYKKVNNYILVHAGLNGIFLPVIILVYFSTSSSRYHPGDYSDYYKHMIADYRISDSLKVINKDNHNHTSNFDEDTPKSILSSAVYHIDAIQTKFSCCGVDSAQDWVKLWDSYISPTCCKEHDKQTNPVWSARFNVDPNYEFEYCTESNAYHLSCLVALKEDEYTKFAWLGDLIIFMIVITIANTFFSMILFGLNKTEDDVYDANEHELTMVGAFAKPRPSQPTITSIKPRQSVVHNIGMTQESISTRAHAVRFNLSHNPKNPISGQSKFSAAARRGSSFL